MRLVVVLALLLAGCSSSHEEDPGAPDPNLPDAGAPMSPGPMSPGPMPTPPWGDPPPGAPGPGASCAAPRCAQTCVAYAQDANGCSTCECSIRFMCPPIEPSCVRTTTRVDRCEVCAWHNDDISCSDPRCGLGDDAECDYSNERCVRRVRTHLTFELTFQAPEEWAPPPQAGQTISMEIEDRGYSSTYIEYDFGGRATAIYDGGFPTTTIEADADLLPDHIYRPTIWFGQWASRDGFGVSTNAPSTRVEMMPLRPL